MFKQYLVLVLLNQVASALFRCIAAVGRNLIVSATLGSFVLLLLFANGGYVLSRGTISAHFFLKRRGFLMIKPIRITNKFDFQSKSSSLSLFFAAERIKKWWKWGYWISPLMYGQNAIAANEFLGKNWRRVNS